MLVGSSPVGTSKFLLSRRATVEYRCNTCNEYLTICQLLIVLTMYRIGRDVSSTSQAQVAYPTLLTQAYRLC